MAFLARRGHTLTEQRLSPETNKGISMGDALVDMVRFDLWDVVAHAAEDHVVDRLWSPEGRRRSSVGTTSEPFP